jgi:hypothetical protein
MNEEMEDRFKDIIYEVRIVNGLVVFNMVILGAILLTVMGILWLK